MVTLWHTYLVLEKVPYTHTHTHRYMVPRCSELSGYQILFVKIDQNFQKRCEQKSNGYLGKKLLRSFFLFLCFLLFLSHLYFEVVFIFQVPLNFLDLPHLLCCFPFLCHFHFWVVFLVEVVFSFFWVLPIRVS